MCIWQETEDAAGGGVAGTPAYLAPEVLAGRAATAQSDLYSVGVLLFHLLTGAYPIEAGTLDELREAHARGQKRRLPASRPDLPAPFTDVVDRAMAPDARDRFPDAAALESAIAGTVEGSGWRTGRHRAIAAVAVASTITLGILGWNGIAGWRSASDAARPATAGTEVGRVTTQSAEARRVRVVVRPRLEGSMASCRRRGPARHIDRSAIRIRATVAGMVPSEHWGAAG